MLTTDSDTLAGMSAYIDGKLKRYNLLFAVNGGAFAIARLMAEPGSPGLILGRLELRHLAIGAIVFTGVMAVDIYLFANMMRRRFLGSLVFGPAGKVVLALMTLLLLLGWTAVASDGWTVLVLVLVVLFGTGAVLRDERGGAAPPRGSP